MWKYCEPAWPVQLREDRWIPGVGGSAEQQEKGSWTSFSSIYIRHWLLIALIGGLAIYVRPLGFIDLQQVLVTGFILIAVSHRHC